MKNVKAKITLLLLLCFSSAINISAIADSTVGVKVGNWIKYEITYTGTPPSGSLIAQWIKVEILNVAGTTVNARMTSHMADGTETNQTGTIDVVSGSATFPGFIIPANSKVGDSVNMGTMGSATIADETTRTYAGASRTVVYANFSQVLFASFSQYATQFSQYGTQYTLYWDKQTGVVVEALTTSTNFTSTAKATETNMWGGLFWGLDWWFWVILIVVVVGAVTAAILILRRRKPSVTPPPPPPPPLT